MPTINSSVLWSQQVWAIPNLTKKQQQETHPIPSGQITIPKPDFFSGILMGNVQLPLWLFYSQGPNMVTHQDDMTFYF